MYRRVARGRVLLLVFLALSIFVITVDFRQGARGPLKQVKHGASAVVAPSQRGFTAVTEPVGDFFSSLADLTRLRSDNLRLEEEVQELRAKADQVASLATENTELRNLLDLEKRWTEMRPVTAQVIAQVPANFKWAVVIDKGRSDGIKPGMAVIHLNGLVGKVIQSSEQTSTVLLLIDPEAAAGARIEGVEDTGTVIGNGEGEYLTLDYISTDASVAVGDDVVTSGYDRGIFPPNIPIGFVASVSGDTAAVQSDISVQPAVDFGALDHVTVLLDSGDHGKTGAGKAR